MTVDYLELRGIMVIDFGSQETSLVSWLEEWHQRC